jgi:hypothetical protein
MQKTAELSRKLLTFEDLLQKRRELLATDPRISDREVARLIAAWSGLEREDVACALVWAEKRHPVRIRRPSEAQRPILVQRSA